MEKVLQITNYMYPHIGGIEQVTRDIGNSLKGKYEQKIICFNHEKGNKNDNVDGIEVNRVNCQCKIASQSIALSYGKKLKKIINEYNPNIVIFHYPNPYAAFFLEKYLKHKKFKFILYWHLDIIKQKIIKLFFYKQNKKLLKMADTIIATSPNYIEGSPWLAPFKNKCRVVPCCINEERLKYSEYNLLQAKKIKQSYNNKKICFAFGRHVEYKGLEYLIKASEFLTNDYKILIGGSGPLTKKLKYEARNDKKIVFLGKLSDEELKNYLLACDIFCFPSITKNEAFGIGLAEAMYYSKPAITFNIPGSGVNYVNLNNITGLEVENKNIKAYANAINNINIEQYKLAAKKRVEDLFLNSKFKENILSVIGDDYEKNCF